MAKTGPGGRPTKLTPALQERLVKVIEAGNYIETAAAYAGLSKESLYGWMRRGRRERDRLEKDGRLRPRQEEKPYLEFLDAIEKALASSEVADLQRIDAAADQQWQAAAWRLERRMPAKWGRRNFVRVNLENEVERFLGELEKTVDAETWEKVRDAAVALCAEADGAGSGVEN
jgi:transposase